MAETVNEIEITAPEMDALIERMESTLSDGLSPEPEDVRLILQILRQFATMQQKLEGSTYLKERYLKLMGLVSATETQNNVLKKGKGTRSNKTQKARKKKAKSTSPEVPPKTCHHTLEGLSKGQDCPECEKGRLYKTDPASFIRIVGQSPLSAENHIMERLRCNLCGELFTAQLPDDVKKDGPRQQKYGYSAKAIMAITKFYMGNPYYRQESLQSFMGVPVTASTIYDQCALLATSVLPVFNTLKDYSANADAYNIDDTHHRILEERSIEKPNRNGQGVRVRTGIYSSCLIASWDTGQQVALFKTNIGHSGEWIDEILSQRQDGLLLPRVMSDALSSNIPQTAASQLTLCNAHSRRKFTDVATHFPEEVAFAIETYAAIWQNETQCAAEDMSAEKRLAYHNEHSLPVMERLKSWCETQQNENAKMEDNSGLGKAIKYFLKHYTKLSAFCYIQGADIDNNLAERVLKIIVRGRKNAYFYKTQAGADVGDVITSLISTCELNGVNIFEYLTILQQNRRAVEVSPEIWLPWNYQEALSSKDQANIA